MTSLLSAPQAQVAFKPEIVGALALFLLEKTGSIFGSFEGRISAAVQRAFFGCKPFGKCLVKIDGKTERFYIGRKVCFGTDCEWTTTDWLTLEQRIHRGEDPSSLGRNRWLQM